MTTLTLFADDDDQSRRDRLKALGLYGLLAQWESFKDRPWIDELLEVENSERQRRSLERRLKTARIGDFRPMSEFDWSWPSKVDRELLEDLFQLDFLEERASVVLSGANGLGKTMIAQNLAYQAVLRGFKVRFYNASMLLNDLASKETAAQLQRAFKAVMSPTLVVLDEIGYLSYDSRYADLLFEIVSRRHQLSRPLVVTTNKPFQEWGEVFPNAASVVALVDRLVHRATIVKIEGDSYRKKEAEELEKRNQEKRRARRSKKGKKA